MLFLSRRFSKDEVEAKLKAAKNFVWLARRMPPEQAKRVKALELEGVGFVKESRTAVVVLSNTTEDFVDPLGVSVLELLQK